MTSREFCYWLQGYFEINNVTNNELGKVLVHSQVEMIEKHLNMVFVHEIDPSYTETDKLDEIHNGPPAPPKPPNKQPPFGASYLDKDKKARC